MNRPLSTTIAVMLFLIVLTTASLVFFVVQSRQGDTQKILVLCGGSMRLPMEKIIEDYKEISDTEIELTVGGSGTLLSQIELTRKGDVFVCHDPFITLAEKNGVIDEWKSVGHMKPIIVVKKANPHNIHDFLDLANPGLRLGVGDPWYSTSGVITDLMIKNSGKSDEILDNIKVSTHGGHRLATDVDLGSLDAVVIWDAIAFNFRDKLDTVKIGEKYEIDSYSSATFGVTDLRKIKVNIALIKYSDSKEEARKFWKYATTEGMSVFREYGFNM